MKNAAKLVFEKCMGLNRDEKVLIITDENKRDIAEVFFHAARGMTDKAGLIEIPVMQQNGEEPESDVADEMKKSDVILLLTTKSLSHTKARKRASMNGARIASLPGITEQMVHALFVDYDRLKQLTQKVASRLEGSRHILVKTDKGTDIIMKVQDRIVDEDDGNLTAPKSFGNLPAGEASLSPIENETSGKFVVDLSIAGIGRLKEPVKIFVEHGFITKIEGGTEAKQLEKMLKDVKNRLAYNIAELGIGTNPNARITGHILEDEKVMGTAHIGIGSNISYNGKIDVPIHIDCVFSKPTIIVDGKRLIENGKFMIEKRVD